MKLLQVIYNFIFRIFHIICRHYYMPTKLGLVKIGNPDKNSPVFISGNYSWTVHLLKKKLKDFDCYLLIANSRGSNVWCAAGMDEFTHYDVIDAIIVSDLKNVVNHQKIIAPPFSAPGVEASIITKVTGFKMLWGPTDLNDLPEFIRNNYKRTEDMTQVRYRLFDRIEHAITGTLATIMSIILPAILLLIFDLIPLELFIGGILLVFAGYLLSAILWNVLPKEKYYIRTLTFTIIFNLLLFSYLYLKGDSMMNYIKWEAVLLIVVFVIATDLCGSSSLYKTTITHWLSHGNYESLFKPIIDPNKCTGCKKCLEVCPKGVLAYNDNKRAVSVHPENCFECLACVKQCNFDAFYNTSGKYKKDIKSIQNINDIMTRDWTYLIEEKKWLGRGTIFSDGIFKVNRQESDTELLNELSLQKKATVS